MNEQHTPISRIIRERLQESGAEFVANSNIADHIKEGELELLQEEVQGKVQELLESLVIDTANDHNTRETAGRVAKMYMQEVFKGRYIQKPKVTDFPNVTQLDEMYVLGPIDVRSACSHHLVPIIGQCWIGVVPGKNVIGISKFHRLADWIMSRPQIQEEAVMKLADEIEQAVEPNGLGIVMKATHMCMTWRGVKATNESAMTNSVMRGCFRENPTVRNEFLSLINGQGFIR